MIHHYKLENVHAEPTLVGKDEDRYPKTQALTQNPRAGWVQTKFSKPIAPGIYMLKRSIPVLVEETRVATQRMSCVRRNSGGESGVSPCQLHAPTRASALACFQRPTQAQIFVAVWPLPWATASNHGSSMLGAGAGTLMENCPQAANSVLLCVHTSAATENPLTCSHRCAWTQ